LTDDEISQRAGVWFDRWRAQYDVAHPVPRTTIDLGDGEMATTGARVLGFSFVTLADLEHAVAASMPWVLVTDEELVTAIRDTWQHDGTDSPGGERTICVIRIQG